MEAGLVADLLERLESMTIMADVADGAIQGRLVGRSQLEISFHDCRDYDESDASTLEYYLEQLLTALFEGQRQGFYSRISQNSTSPVTEDYEPLTMSGKKYKQLRENAILGGESPRRFVNIRSVGMREFEVALDDRVVEEIDVDTFVQECRLALKDLWIDYRQALADIRSEVYTTHIKNEAR